MTPGLSGAVESDSIPDRIGQYEIIEELGRGGMGRVYAARQIGLGRIVALKVMAGAALGADFELRFLREAQTAARLRHPNLVAVHDSGRADGQLYFSMDYIEGGDLAQRLRGKAFAPWEAASILRKVTLALAHAHAEGVLHRDLKPSNILLDGDEPKLADFGLAAQLEAGGDLTAATGVLGTPHYLAPEALRLGSGALSVSSDIYALGVVLFELLTGRTPFAGAAPAALVALVENSEPPAPRLLAPAVPRDLETICLKCLEREPGRRYASAVDLAEDLRRFLDGEPIIARPLSGPARFFRWCRRRPALASVWVLVTALAVGSTAAAVTIQRTLGRALKAEGDGRERLRDARVAEAAAIRRTTEPGRRTRAIAALSEAWQIRPGEDIRDEMVASLLIPDIRRIDTWTLPPEMAEVNFDAAGKIATLSARDAIGQGHSDASLIRWGEKEPFLSLNTGGARLLGQVRLSKDGTLVVARLADDTLRVWRVGETNPVLTISGRAAPGGEIHTEPFNDDYDLSPDGQFVVLGLPEKGFSIHRIADGSEVGRWPNGDHFTRIRFSADGRLVAAFDGSRNDADTVFVVGTTDFTERCHIKLHAAPNSVAWSPDGHEMIVGMGDNSIAVYDTLAWRYLSFIHSPLRDPNELVFLGHGSLVALRGYGTALHLLNIALGADEVVIDGFGPSALAATLSGDQFTVALLNGAAGRWEVLEPVGLKILPPPKPPGYEQAFNNCSFDFSPDGQWLVSSHGRYTLLRETATGLLFDQLEDPGMAGFEYATAAFTPDGRSVYRHSDLTGLRRYPLLIGTNGLPTFGPPVQLSDEKQLLMTDHSPGANYMAMVDAGGKFVKVFGIKSNELVELGRFATLGAYSAALSPDASQVLVNCGGTGPDAPNQRLRVYRLADGSVVKELNEPAFGEASWSRDGHTAITSNGIDRTVIWDTATWRPRLALNGVLAGNASTFILAPDGNSFAVVRDENVSIASTEDGSKLAAFQSPQAPGTAAAVRFRPDGKGIGVLWRDGRVDLFDPAPVNAELKKLGVNR